ncbi:MAG: WhiB family transcriptional regulator [Microthrixaceae bacterium]
MDENWARKAACRGLDPAIFYPPTDEDAVAAKAVCGECPVRRECLEHAIEHREKNGVWGGETERERLRIIRRRRRARAAVSEIAS